MNIGADHLITLLQYFKLPGVDHPAGDNIRTDLTEWGLLKVRPVGWPEYRITSKGRQYITCVLVVPADADQRFAYLDAMNGLEMARELLADPDPRVRALVRQIEGRDRYKPELPR